MRSRLRSGILKAVIAVVLAAIVFAGGLAVFHHETGTVSSDETALRKVTNCPAATPDACVGAAAAVFALPAATMPRISIPTGFTYRSGSVGRDGAGVPNAVYDFFVTRPDVFTLRIAPRSSFSAPALTQMQSWPVTPGRAGRRYREVSDRSGVVSLVYLDPTFVYSVDTAIGYLSAPDQLVPAAEILDAVR